MTANDNICLSAHFSFIRMPKNKYINLCPSKRTNTKLIIHVSSRLLRQCICLPLAELLHDLHNGMSLERLHVVQQLRDPVAQLVELLDADFEITYSTIAQYDLEHEHRTHHARERTARDNDVDSPP